MPYSASHVRALRIHTFSMPAFSMRAQAASSISALASTSTSCVFGSRMSVNDVRPRMRLESEALTSSPSTMASTSMPLTVLQSSVEMITSCDTSTSLRVR